MRQVLFELADLPKEKGIPSCNRLGFSKSTESRSESVAAGVRLSGGLEERFCLDAELIRLGHQVVYVLPSPEHALQGSVQNDLRLIQMLSDVVQFIYVHRLLVLFYEVSNVRRGFAFASLVVHKIGQQVLEVGGIS